jgi:alpha-L-fucosidase
MKGLRLILVMVLLAMLACSAGVCADAARETDAQRNARMKWWRQAKFGMFIHWGLYSVPAGTWNGQQIPGIGEWIMNAARIPVNDYANLAKSFNPVKFNADQWARTAKNAGMKYIVITSKHHDGFAMFHSTASQYNIYDATPFKRDPLKELADACKKHKIKLGFYYSQAQDWHHPGGGVYADGGPWDILQKGNIDTYVKRIAIPQVREILSNYGKISVLWWDTPVGMSPESVRELYGLTKLQPGIITNDRLGNGVPGDLTTPEQTIPGKGMGNRDWETCMTINDTWGFKSYDDNWKPTQTLIRNLIDIASKGGNYLLNVGPTSEGTFPEPIIERLSEVGKWMKVNGQAIYGSSPSPFTSSLPWGRCTRKGNKLFLSVFNWPENRSILVPISNDVSKVYMLSDRQKLDWTKTDQGIQIALPDNAPDKIASVVVLEPKGALVIINPNGHVKAGETAKLLVEDSTLHGNTIALEQIDGATNIGFWVNPQDYPEWSVFFEKIGTYEVSLEYSEMPGCGAGGVDLEISDQRLHIQPEPTGGWKDFVVKSFGKIEITKPGKITIILRPKSKETGPVMNLRAVILKPLAG